VRIILYFKEMCMSTGQRFSHYLDLVMARIYLNHWYVIQKWKVYVECFSDFQPFEKKTLQIISWLNYSDFKIKDKND
jgi:hypothetical protein